SDQASAQFGISVASAGDVNGDGCSDFVVGAALYDNGQTNEGRAYAFKARPDIRMTNDAAASFSPVMAVDSSGNHHMVWVDARNGNNEIYYKKVDANWNVLITDTRLTNNIADSLFPAITVSSGGTITVVWSDNRDGNYEIYRKTYTTAWGTDTRRTTTPDDSKEPDVVVDSSGNLYYVWREVLRGANSEDEKIRYQFNDGTPVDLYTMSGA